MSDYISRENALLALDDFLDSEQEYGIIANCYSIADVKKAKNRIMCIPSAVGIDVGEVKHGKWGKAKHQPTSKNFICSACYGLTTLDEIIGAANG